VERVESLTVVVGASAALELMAVLLRGVYSSCAKTGAEVSKRFSFKLLCACPRLQKIVRAIRAMADFRWNILLVLIACTV
jgi:hypothetical protein